MTTAKIGRKEWVIPGGHIPLESTGKEPDFTSHDKLSVLNTTTEEAEIELTIYYTDSEPVGPYPFCVGAQRVRQVRFNDLIKPYAMPLDTPFACVLRASVPVVVQFTRQDTRQSANAGFTTIAFPADNQ